MAKKIPPSKTMTKKRATETGKIKAHFEDGVLEIRLPRTKVAEKKHKKIPVE